MIVAPAMNTEMWEHPLTQPHLQLLQSWGVRLLAPVARVLACGDVGTGAMAGISDIVESVISAVADLSHDVDEDCTHGATDCPLRVDCMNDGAASAPAPA